MGQEILVVCLVESSVALSHEWNDVLLTYVSPLLQRIATAGVAKGSSLNELRIGFISYSDSYVHPNPILARRFFSPVLQLTKELNDDPASLGIGRTASGGHKGMAVLEGYTAVLEMFDAVGETRPPLRPHLTNEAQSEMPGYDPTTCYLIHIASSPPDSAIRPSWNTNPALDEVTWASLPSELLKRKIRSTMILTRPVPELLDLHKHISRIPDPSWISLIKPSHRLLFSGLPPKDPTKTVPQKRAATESLENPQQPAQPRPPSQEQLATVNPPAATTVPGIPSNSIGTTNSSPSRPGSVTMQPSSDPQPQPHPPIQVQAPSHNNTQPQPQPPSAQSRPTALGQNIDPVKLLNYIRMTEADCRTKVLAFDEARKVGKPQAELEAMQSELTNKLLMRSKLLGVYQQQLHRQQANGGAAPSLPITALNTQPAGSGPTQQARPTQDQPEAHINPPNPGPSGRGVPFPNFPGPNLGNTSPFQNIPISARAGMEAQMQKMLAERTRPPVLAAAPQTQPQPQLPAQNPLQPMQSNSSMPPNQATSPNLTSNPNLGDIMTPRASLGTNARRWEGALTWPTSKLANAGVRKENILFIALFSQDDNLRCDSWPRKLNLQPSQCSLNMTQILGWVKEFSPSMALISSTPVPGNIEATTQNARSFRQLKGLLQGKNMLAFCKFDIAGGPPGTGLVAFPTNNANQGDLLVAMIFRMSAMPAAVVGSAPASQAPSAQVPGTSTEVSQAMNAGAGPLSLQNLPAETKAYLQKRQAAALAAYNQQQLAQQAHQQGIVTNAGTSSAGQVPGAPFNVVPFLQGMPGMQQQTEGGNQMGLGELSIPQAPALQQVQHRQPSGFNPGQMNLQMLQYPMNRRPDDGQV